MELGLAIGLIVGLSILFLLVGGITAFFVTKKIFEKQLRENPPINESMIRVMFNQMGVKASEARIKQVMRSMQNAK
ncbi:YneF family protein [Mycoplasmopsis agassizii]|uniref:Uncharacterized protein n=1 Tax=Mycoplasmopsis agassizii TaxID=33922 RepID=A0A1W1X0T5_9BACT|nr:YneF family protein [Mycoplasmopsis agassizii]PAF55007.1 hypothetical protein CJF60_04720 [Mycoplasmopsis agassizii]PAK21325.1 hypothetical protein CJJ23_02720 [Mycoplasmopsis agassizii]SMC17576.1 hypothetical protein SAMN02745179_00495 [Mycoplasmopsis agassizii]